MANFFTGLPAAAIGASLAIATVPLRLYLSLAQSEQFAAVLPGCCGAIYIGFGLQTGNQSQIATEVSVAIGFISAALGGLWISAWLVPLAGPRMEFGTTHTTRVRNLPLNPGSLSQSPRGILHYVPSLIGL
jgi:hypothetical protein